MLKPAKNAKTFLDMASHPPLVVEHSRIHFAQTGSPRIGSLSHALGKGDASSQKLTFFADRQFFFAIQITEAFTRWQKSSFHDK